MQLGKTGRKNKMLTVKGMIVVLLIFIVIAIIVAAIFALRFFLRAGASGIYIAGKAKGYPDPK